MDCNNQNQEEEEKKRRFLIPILIALLLAIGIVGVGYALQTSVENNNNTLDKEVYQIDLYDGNTATPDYANGTTSLKFSEGALDIYSTIKVETSGAPRSIAYNVDDDNVFLTESIYDANTSKVVIGDENKAVKVAFLTTDDNTTKATVKAKVTVDKSGLIGEGENWTFGDITIYLADSTGTIKQTWNDLTDGTLSTDTYEMDAGADKALYVALRMDAKYNGAAWTSKDIAEQQVGVIKVNVHFEVTNPMSTPSTNN